MVVSSAGIEPAPPPSEGDIVSIQIRGQIILCAGLPADEAGNADES